MVLNYWIEETDRVWIKVPTIPADDKVVLRIEKTGSETPDGDSTFEFFDDFSGSSLDTTKWDETSNLGSITVSNDKIELYRATIKSKTLFGKGYAVKGHWRCTTDINYPVIWTGFNIPRDPSTIDSNSLSIYSLWDGVRADPGRNLIVLEKEDNRVLSNTFSSSYYADGTWYVTEIRNISNDLVVGTWREPPNTSFETLSYTDSSDIPTVDMSVCIGTRGDSDSNGNTRGEWYWVLARKIMENEPTITVTDQSTYYEVEIDNTGGSELTDYQVSIEASDLGGVANDESLNIQEEGFSVTTLDATDITKNSVTLNGEVEL